MGTQQERITDTRTLTSNPERFLNRKLNVVMRNNTVSFGKLRSSSGTEIILQNLRGKRIRIKLEDILEIYADSNF